MFLRLQTVRPGLPRWGYTLLLAVLIGLFAVGPAVALFAPAPATRLAEPAGPPGESEEEESHESPSLPAAPRSVRPHAPIPAFVQFLPTGPRCPTSDGPSSGRPLAITGLPLSIPLRC